MSLVFVFCARCRVRCELERGAVNRAAKIGAPLYCGRECAGIARRRFKTLGQKKGEKATYDAKRRALLLPEIKAKKAAYHRRTYDPVKAAEQRKKTMPRHVEYCRRPAYKAAKVEYDRRRRAAEYGEFADAFLLLVSLDREVNSRISDYDVRIINGTLNKSQQRKRSYGTQAQR